MGLSYSEYVKKPGQEYDYTIEEAKELLKCSEDFYYFLKYVHIIHPDHGRIDFEPYPYQMDIFNLILNNRYIVAMVSRQAGKCLCPDTVIRFRNKKTKEIIEIEIGKFYENMSKRK